MIKGESNLKNIIKMMKPGDIMIVALLVILSFLPVAIFSYQSTVTEESTMEAIITSDGEVVEKIALSDDGEMEIFDYTDSHGHQNTVAREGMTVYIIDASCADQLCVRQGSINNIGETIVCLPHRFIVEISSESDEEDINDNNEIDAVTYLGKNNTK